MADTEKMAPTTSIETVMIVRPYKVAAVLFGFVNLILMVMFIGASTWVSLGDRRMGLWEECVTVSPGRVECDPTDPPNWMMACRVLCIIGFMLCFCASVVVCIGLNAGKFSARYRCYFVAMLIYFLAVMFNATALVIYPVYYSEMIGMRAGTESWSFGWAYALGWASTALMTFSAFLICLDKDADEVAFREVTDYENGIEEDEKLTETITDKSDTGSDIAYADECFK